MSVKVVWMFFHSLRIEKVSESVAFLMMAYWGMSSKNGLNNLQHQTEDRSNASFFCAKYLRFLNFSARKDFSFST